MAYFLCSKSHSPIPCQSADFQFLFCPIDRSIDYPINALSTIGLISTQITTYRARLTSVPLHILISDLGLFHFPSFDGITMTFYAFIVDFRTISFSLFVKLFPMTSFLCLHNFGFYHRVPFPDFIWLWCCLFSQNRLHLHYVHDFSRN